MSSILEIFESFESDVHDFAKGVLNFDFRKEDDVIGKEISFRRTSSPSSWETTCEAKAPCTSFWPKEGTNIFYERGIPVRKMRRKKKKQVTMIDTTRLQHVDTFTRLGLKQKNSSLSSVHTCSECSSISFSIKHGLK